MITSRKVKFRAWDTKRKKMFYPNGILYSTNNECGYPGIGQNFEGEDRGYWTDDGFSDDKVILLQFTNLIDKKGKELYEGDIIKHESSTLTYLVEFSNGRFCASWEYEWGHIDPLRLRKDVPYGFEVIGNMFDNPELLKSHEVEEVLF